MITGDFVNGLHLMVGLSTDTKPDSTSENSFFLEEDSGDVYYFSAGQWEEAPAAVGSFISSLLGGGTPGGGGDVTAAAVAAAVAAMTATQKTNTRTNLGAEAASLTVGFTHTPTCDTLFSDISSAFAAEKIIKAYLGDVAGILARCDMLEAEFWFLDDTGGAPTLFIFTVADTNNVTMDTRILGNAVEPTEVAVTGSTPSIAAADNHIYTCGEVTSLTITGGMTGEYTVVFISGATATVLNLPPALDDMMPDGFSVEANTKYEINVRDGWPFVGKKAVS